MMKLLLVGFKDQTRTVLMDLLPEESRSDIGEFPGSFISIYEDVTADPSKCALASYETTVFAPSPELYVPPAALSSDRRKQSSPIETAFSYDYLLGVVFENIFTTFLNPESPSRNLIIFTPPRSNLDIPLPADMRANVPLGIPFSDNAMKFYGTVLFSKLFKFLILGGNLLPPDGILRKLPLQYQKDRNPLEWLCVAKNGDISSWPKKMWNSPFKKEIRRYGVGESPRFPSAIGIHWKKKNIYLLPTPETDDDLLEHLLSLAAEPDNNLDAYCEMLKKTRNKGDLELIGESERIKQLKSKLLLTAKDRQGHVILIGESGVGKELAAKTIHEASGRKGEYIIVNCALLKEDFAYSEIFGHIKGAFTGAVRPRDGAVRRADGGCLFLDELHLLDDSVKGMLLRFMQSGTFTKFGGVKEEASDVKIIAATNLQAIMSNEGLISSGFLPRFRHDVNVPALRYHREDISLYVNLFSKSEIDSHINLYDMPDNVTAVISEKLEEILESDWKLRSWRNTNIRGLQTEVKNFVLKFFLKMEMEGKITKKPEKRLHSKPTLKKDSRGRTKGSGYLTDDDFMICLNEAENTKALLNRFQGKGSKGKTAYADISRLRRRITNINDYEIKKEAYRLLKIKFQDFPKDNKYGAR